MGLDILKMTDGNQTTIQEGADSKKGGGRWEEGGGRQRGGKWERRNL
jgi:hypothetical protein